MAKINKINKWLIWDIRYKDRKSFEEIAALLSLPLTDVISQCGVVERMVEQVGDKAREQIQERAQKWLR